MQIKWTISGDGSGKLTLVVKGRLKRKAARQDTNVAIDFQALSNFMLTEMMASITVPQRTIWEPKLRRMAER